MTLTLPGKRPVSSFLGRISLCPVTVNFWLYSIHEDDWFSPIHHRLGPGCAFRASRDTGMALWRTQNFGDIRVRLVEYSPGYSADHWCSKGHVLLCLEGELHTTQADGKSFTLTPGKSYQVADGESSHRSSTKTGAKLFIVD